MTNPPSWKTMLELRGLTKLYGDFSAVKDLNLTIQENEFFCLLGPSGCGKTTTLRMIAGFEKPDEGNIFLNGSDLKDVPAHKRNINTVFQSYALFPHLNVFENIAFGLRMSHVPEKEIQDRVENMLKTVALDGFAQRLPGKLSGGQQQRVTLARALVNEPKILLLDEPLAALDEKLRLQMQVELANLQRKVGITFIFITHNQEEALTMADRIAVMENGNIIQIGLPDDIYLKPKSRFVASFIGQMNFMKLDTLETSDEGVQITLPDGHVIRLDQSVPLANPDELRFGIRPEQLRMSRTAPLPSENGLKGHILNEVYYGDSSIFVVQLENESTVSVMHQNYLPSGNNPESFIEGEDIFVCWSTRAGCLLPE
ncbi:MAG: ABC transporter ATP-binding protein [Candidatus Marinimicrobia bacterium]|nr:ABC transporter ATP-binding protein [Candidatus Neomarinimicrobiota bacterium]